MELVDVSTLCAIFFLMGVAGGLYLGWSWSQSKMPKPKSMPYWFNQIEPFMKCNPTELTIDFIRNRVSVKASINK